MTTFQSISAPFDPASAFEHTRNDKVRGAHQVVANAAALADIPQELLKVGMRVTVNDTGIVYELTALVIVDADNDTRTWEQAAEQTRLAPGDATITGEADASYAAAAMDAAGNIASKMMPDGSFVWGNVRFQSFHGFGRKEDFVSTELFLEKRSDLAGNDFWRIDPGGVFVFGHVRICAESGFGRKITYESSADWTDRETDMQDRDISRTLIDGTHRLGRVWADRMRIGTSGIADSGAAFWQAADAEAREWSEDVLTSTIFGICYDDANYVQCASFGQSLERGYEGFPVVTTTTVSYVKTLGDSVQAAGGTSWDPITTVSGSPASFQNAVGRVLNLSVNGYLDSAAIAALDYHDDNQAEAPILGFTRALAELTRNYKNSSTPGYNFVATSSGQGGQPISVLGGARFVRLEEALEKVEAEAVIQGGALARDWACRALLWIHGPADYSAGTTRTAYADALNTLFDDADAVLVAEGQSEPCLKLIVQVGGDYVDDTLHQAIAMAQLDVADSRFDTVVVGPDYKYTDKDHSSGEDAHLAANGYRWIGEDCALVAHRITNLKQGWTPTRPYKVYRDPENPSCWYITFAGPHGRLGFEAAYDANAEYWATYYGVRFSDDTGDVEMKAWPEIIGARTIRCDLTRVLGAGARLTIGGEEMDGNSNIAIRSSHRATSNYEFVTDMDASEEIAALVDKPYPTHAFCVNFSELLPYYLPDQINSLS